MCTLTCSLHVLLCQVQEETQQGSHALQRLAQIAPIPLAEVLIDGVVENCVARVKASVEPWYQDLEAAAKLKEAFTGACSPSSIWTHVRRA